MFQVLWAEMSPIWLKPVRRLERWRATRPKQRFPVTQTRPIAGWGGGVLIRLSRGRGLGEGVGLFKGGLLGDAGVVIGKNQLFVH